MASGPVTTGVDIGGETVSGGGQLDFSNLLPSILEKFIAVIEGAVIILAGIFAMRYIRARLRKVESTHEQQRNAINLLEKIISGFVIVITMTLALKVIGLDMTLLVSVGILGLSYGLQDIIKNYVAGILILFKAPFKIGDVVKIRDFTGRVSKIDFQSTTLETFDNRHITIYNSDVMTQSIVNYTNNTMRRLEFDVTVGYGSDIPHAQQIFEKILSNSTNLLKEPKFSVVFKKFTDLGPMFNLKFWVQRPCNILKIRTEIASQISQSFDEEKIFMPYVKGIETEDETVLNKISDERKNRAKTFYGMPVFAEAAVMEQPPQPQIGPDGFPLPPPPMSIDAEEPEA
jgi:small-conductance mechanosensitive channel